jgi:ATP-dependent helicase/nuclease subunit A
MSGDREQFLAKYEQARDRIRTDLGSTLFVEAGAGTGKTSALVDRIIALVQAGTQIEHVIAITFTEKAAAELKDRVRARLEEMLGGIHRDRAAAALEALDRAQISTIHAFGLSLLKAFAAEGGVDPAFEVLDEMRAERRFEERWRAYLSTLHEDTAAAAAFERILGLGLSAWDLQQLARRLAYLPGVAARLLDDPLSSAEPPWPSVEQLLDELDALPLNAVDESDRLRPKIGQLRAACERLTRAGHDREWVLAAGAAALDEKYGSAGRRENWMPFDINVARNAATSVRDALVAHLSACRAAALAAVMPHIARFVLDEDAARKREGTLVFDDLIAGPRALLRDPGAVHSLRERYSVMLIDEFQDTDPLQTEIALAFATDPETGTIEPGRLFVVGDPKQSIYRFRRADMTAYDYARRQLAPGGAGHVPLSLNHRSRPVITEWVNRVFAELIGGGARPQIQPPYTPIHPQRDAALAGPGIATIGGERPGTARDCRRVETRAVAGLCAKILADGWEVCDRSLDTPRPVRFGDIAILIPTRTVLVPLERALQRAGIPYRVEGGSLVYQTQEVRDLINCLAAIDDPSDEVAVVGALRSVAFGCSDVELAEFRLGAGRFNYLSRDLEGRGGPVAEGLGCLKAYHERRHDVSLAALVERFIADRGPDETGILVHASRDSFRRVRFVAGQARAFEASAPASLRSFVTWMEGRAGDAILDHEGAGLDDDEDAVRILTVHGAKGLEFPIVIAAGLAAKPNTRPGTFAVDRGQPFAVAVRAGSKSRNNLCELGDTTRLHALEDQHVEAEFIRLLYVAATRARDHLVVSLFHTDKERKAAARQLIDAGACVDVVELEIPEAPERELLAPLAGLDVEPFRDGEAGFMAARADLLGRAHQQRFVSATSLRAETEADDAAERRDETEPWARGRGATRLGRAVHAAIQSLPLDADAKLVAAHARAQAVAEAIPHRSAEVERLVSRALHSDAAARARAAQRAMREVPFAVPRGDAILEGFIDLVIETDEGLEIVDWKTDRIDAADVPERLARYRDQAGLYVLGLEAATGRRASRVTYVFISAGAEASPGDPGELAGEAASAVARAVT